MILCKNLCVCENLSLFFFFLFLLNKMILDINNRPIQESLQKDGYVIVDGLIPKESFQQLMDACDRVVERARKGDWKYR